jgi:DNA-binding Lrp family transcriptional regulator
MKMADASSTRGTNVPGGVRFRPDALDHVLLDLLERDGRMSNKDLAAAAGIAPSTAHARVRALLRAGVIRGIHAELDLDALGRDLQAVVAVRVHPAARARLSPLAKELSARPEVRDVYLLGGTEDLLVHVAVESTEALRAFVVDGLSSRREIAHTQTSVVFEHLRAGSAPPTT